MNLLMLIVSIVLVLSVYYFLLKNTIFGINAKSGNYVGFFVFYDLIIYIVPAILLLNIFPIEDFRVAFKVKQETVFWISSLILISLLVFYITLKILSGVNRRYFYLFPYTLSKNTNIQNFIRITVFISLSLILFAWLLYGVSHAFTTSFISDISISTLRSEIKANSSVKALKHLFIFISPFIVAVIASPIYKKNKVERILLLISILYITSWGGSKGPLLGSFIVYMISYATFNNLRMNVYILFKLLIFTILLLFIVYKVVLFQYSDLTDLTAFLDYFTQRMFVAQTIGVYEEFNLFLNNYSYIWHGVPFASSFIDFPVFHKDLMLISEDRINPSTIGIKNTFFIAEAYGMGGWLLLALSPVWMAINYALTYIWMTFIIDKLAFKNFEYTKRIVGIALFSYISIMGGFSDLMFFKLTIMITIQIITFLIVTNFIKKIKVYKKKETYV